MTQNKVSAVSKPYVVSELAGIVKKERAQREQLWASGVVKSARMRPRACENLISAEEVSGIPGGFICWCWHGALACHRDVADVPSASGSECCVA
jgi:hypothetical protein